jgi:hypothetical protein
MVKRVNYFDGQFLRPKDFIDEQGYHVGMRQQHNQFLHSWGIADGLVPSADKGAKQVTVSPGFAIDIAGQEIKLDNADVSPDLLSFVGKSPYLTIAFNQTATDHITEKGTSGDTRIDLKPIIGLKETPIRGQELILGKITLDGQGGFQSVDTSSAVRTTAGARGGDLSVVSLNLTGLHIDDPNQQPRLSVSVPGRVDLQGSLKISGDLTAAGKVGIGTTSAADQLHIYRGDDSAWSGRGVFSGLTNAAVVGTYQGVAVVGAHAAALNAWSTLYVNNDGKSGGGNTIMGIGGNVGIGTTSPSCKLQIAGNLWINAGSGNTVARAQGLTVDSAVGGTYVNGTDPGDSLRTMSVITSANATAPTILTLRNVTAGRFWDVVLDSNEDAKLKFSQAGSQPTLTMSGGNVGIGTSSPTASLHLKDAGASRFTLRVQSAAANNSNQWGGIGFSGEDSNIKGAIIFQSLGVDYSRGNMIFALNNAQDQSNASPADAVMTLTATGVSAPAFITTNPMNHRMYPDDPLIYQDILDAKNAGAIAKYGNPSVYSETNFPDWGHRRLFTYGQKEEADGNGALVIVPEGYTTVWVRICGDRWNAIKAYNARENLGIWVGGFRGLNSYSPDGSMPDGTTPNSNMTLHQWMPIPVKQPGQLILTSKKETNDIFYLSGLAFSRNPWAHAAQSAIAFHWTSNGGTAVGWGNDNVWNNDQLGTVPAGGLALLKVPVVPSGRDKLLYIIEHNSNWVGALFTGIKVNGKPIERFLASYNNPFARHWNSKLNERYLAALVPAALVGDKRFLDVEIDMSKQDNVFNFREMGTHDLEVPLSR